jgi:5'-phosphate synthase pdxT subunit
VVISLRISECPAVDYGRYYSFNHAMSITVGVLALQGAFYEHLKLLRQAAARIATNDPGKWIFIEVRTVPQLERCDALIIPGGESTTISLVAARSLLLEPLRDFVKYVRKFFMPGLQNLTVSPTDSSASQPGVHVPGLFYSQSRQIAPSKGVRS